MKLDFLKKTLLISVLISLFHTHNIKAQDADIGAWYIYFGNVQITPRWGLWLEGQHRNYNLLGDLEQAFFRTAALYNLPEAKSQLALGYGFFHTQSYLPGTDDKRSFHEHRFYQQFLTNQRFGRVYLVHRYRLEERFVDEQDFKLRFRYLLGLNFCLNKPERVPGTVYLSVYNELFINTLSPIFDRDRVYGAVGYVFGKNLRSEVGLMYQLFENRQRPQFQLAVFHNLELGN